MDGKFKQLNKCPTAPDKKYNITDRPEKHVLVAKGGVTKMEAQGFSSFSQ